MQSKQNNIRELKHRRFETRTMTGRQILLLLTHFDLNQSVVNPCFSTFKLDATDKRSVASASGKKKKTQLPAAVYVSTTSMLKISIILERTLTSNNRKVT